MLESIKSDVTRLISLYEAQKYRADELERRLETSEEKVRKYREQIAELNLQIDNLTLLSAFQAGVDKPEAVERINALIREIDRCIRLLEN